MSQADDFLKNLKNQRTTSRKRRRERKPVSNATAGLSPAELLALPPLQGKIVNFLSRHKQATQDELKKALSDFQAEEIEQGLYDLKQATYLREMLVDGEIHYRVVYEERMPAPSAGPLKRIWSRLSIDTPTFLKQTMLFQGMTDAQLDMIAQKMHSRMFHRNEVILWQGEPSDSLYLIKNGIVGISRLSPGSKAPQVLAYLREGHTLGDVGILENQSRSATATALSEVEVLVMERGDFLELLNTHPQTGTQLARMLGNLLVATNERLTQGESQASIVLVFGMDRQSGCTTIGSSMAAMLAHTTDTPSAYTELPHPEHLPERFGFERGIKTYNHPGGYDVVVPHLDKSLPSSVRTTLLLDELTAKYKNVVIGLPEQIDSSVVNMVERTSQVVIVTPPDKKAWRKMERLIERLKDSMRPDKTNLFTIVNRVDESQQDMPTPGEADFDLPYLADLSERKRLSDPATELPPQLAELVASLVDRLGRVHQVSIYIPSTIDVDKAFDPTPYIERTLAFMGERFGGATSSQAQGVWNSEEVGLVNETIHIVRSYMTQAELNQYLDGVMKYVEGLKEELTQEAMALEVDQKLMFI